MPKTNEKKETFRLEGKEVVAKVKELIKAGNARRIILQNEKGKTLVEIPLTVGLIGAALLPVLAAVGAIAALATNMTLIVEKRD